MKETKYIVGVDFGGTSIRIALVRFSGASYKIETFASLATTKFNKNSLIVHLTKNILQLKKEVREKGYRIKAVGIGVPGQVSFAKGLVYKLTNVSGWKDVNLKKELQEKIGLPVYVDNDANVMAQAEVRFGAAKNYKDCVCLTLGTGMGGGLILNGKLYRGVNFIAGEIGHMSINEDGLKCACGSIGCAERYVGNRYLLAEAKKRLKHGVKSKVRLLIGKNYEKLTLELLSQAARENDKFAVSFWQEAGTHIGVLLANVVNLLNPQIIVVGGGVAKAGKVLFDAIKKTVKERALPAALKDLKIVPSKLQEKAGLIGAAGLALFEAEED